MKIPCKFTFLLLFLGSICNACTSANYIQKLRKQVKDSENSALKSFLEQSLNQETLTSIGVCPFELANFILKESATQNLPSILAALSENMLQLDLFLIMLHLADDDKAIEQFAYPSQRLVPMKICSLSAEGQKQLLFTKIFDFKHLLLRVMWKKGDRRMAILPEQIILHMPTLIDRKLLWRPRVKISKDEKTLPKDHELLVKHCKEVLWGKDKSNKPADLFMALVEMEDEVLLSFILKDLPVYSEHAHGWIALMTCSKFSPGEIFDMLNKKQKKGSEGLWKTLTKLSQTKPSPENFFDRILDESFAKTDESIGFMQEFVSRLVERMGKFEEQTEHSNTRPQNVEILITTFFIMNTGKFIVDTMKKLISRDYLHLLLNNTFNPFGLLMVLRHCPVNADSLPKLKVILMHLGKLEVIKDHVERDEPVLFECSLNFHPKFFYEACQALGAQFKWIDSDKKLLCEVKSECRIYIDDQISLNGLSKFISERCRPQQESKISVFSPRQGKLVNMSTKETLSLQDLQRQFPTINEKELKAVLQKSLESKDESSASSSSTKPLSKSARKKQKKQKKHSEKLSQEEAKSNHNISISSVPERKTKSAQMNVKKNKKKNEYKQEPFPVKFDPEPFPVKDEKDSEIDKDLVSTLCDLQISAKHTHKETSLKDELSASSPAQSLPEAASILTEQDSKQSSSQKILEVDEIAAPKEDCVNGNERDQSEDIIPINEIETGQNNTNSTQMSSENKVQDKQDVSMEQASTTKLKSEHEKYCRTPSFPSKTKIPSRRPKVKYVPVKKTDSCNEKKETSITSLNIPASPKDSHAFIATSQEIHDRPIETLPNNPKVQIMETDLDDTTVSDGTLETLSTSSLAIDETSPIQSQDGDQMFPLQDFYKELHEEFDENSSTLQSIDEPEQETKSYQSPGHLPSYHIDNGVVYEVSENGELTYTGVVKRNYPAVDHSTKFIEDHKLQLLRNSHIKVYELLMNEVLHYEMYLVQNEATYVLSSKPSQVNRDLYLGSCLKGHDSSDGQGMVVLLSDEFAGNELDWMSREFNERRTKHHHMLIIFIQATFPAFLPVKAMLPSPNAKLTLPLL